MLALTSFGSIVADQNREEPILKMDVDVPGRITPFMEKLKNYAHDRRFGIQLDSAVSDDAPLHFEMFRSDLHIIGDKAAHSSHVQFVLYKWFGDNFCILTNNKEQMAFNAEHGTSCTEFIEEIKKDLSEFPESHSSVTWMKPKTSKENQDHTPWFKGVTIEVAMEQQSIIIEKFLTFAAKHRFAIQASNPSNILVDRSDLEVIVSRNYSKNNSQNGYNFFFYAPQTAALSKPASDEVYKGLQEIAASIPGAVISEQKLPVTR